MFDFAYLDHFSFPIFVLEIDALGVPRYAAFNSTACKLSNRPLRDYLGRTAQDVTAGTHGTEAFAMHCKAVRRGEKTTYQQELPIDEGHRLIRTTLSPVRNKTGEVQWLFGSCHDLTSDDSARKAPETLERLSNEMSQYVAIAAHDLRAPMRNVAALADMLRDAHQSPDNGQLEIIDLLDSVARTSQDLIKDILSNSELSRPTEPPRIVDLRDHCKNLRAVLDPKNRLTLTVAPVLLRIDRRLLQIALRNPIENAIKHAGRHKLEVIITVKSSSPDMVVIRVRDNGKVFSPGALAFLDGGTFGIDSGYGLFAVRQLVNDHGGAIRAHNLIDGSCAVVEITLPGAIITNRHPFLPRARFAPAKNNAPRLSHRRA